MESTATLLHLIRAGESRLVPGERTYRLRVTPSTRPEQIRVAASTVRWNPIQGEKQGPFVVFRTEEAKERWQRQLRGIMLDPTTGGGPQPDPSGKPLAAESILAYQVEPVTK